MQKTLGTKVLRISLTQLWIDIEAVQTHVQALSRFSSALSRTIESSTKTSLCEQFLNCSIWGTFADLAEIQIFSFTNKITMTSILSVRFCVAFEKFGGQHSDC